MTDNLVLLFIALLLVVLNGFFVAAEFGLVKMRATRVRAIARKHGWRGRFLALVHVQLDAYLSACQLGITLSSLGLGWIGEPAFAELLEPLLLLVGITSERVLHLVAFLIAFFIISYLHIVIGELVPKSMAIRASEPVALWTSAPLYGFYWLMFPLIWVLNHSANWILRKLGLDLDKAHESHYSVDELKMILRARRNDADYTADEWRVLAQTLDFRDLDVEDLMRPFREAVVLHASDSVAAAMDKMVAHRFSRYPYLDENGQALGIVHLKDVFFALRQGQLPERLATLVRPTLIVSPNLAALELFRRFRAGMPHFAIVAFEGDEPQGFITLDNLLGALVGEIRDEFRESDSQWTRLDDGSLLGKGSLPIFTLERILGLDTAETDANTVAGLILHQLGDLPEAGQRVTFDGFDIVVTRMFGPRIVEVRVFPQEASLP